MKHGMLTVDIGKGIIQYWFISESKKRTYILVSQKVKKKRKKIKTKIIGWDKFDYIGWWLD